MEFEEAKESFDLTFREEGAWNTLISSLQTTLHHILSSTSTSTGPKEWLAIYQDASSTTPLVVFQTNTCYHPSLEKSEWELPKELPKFDLKMPSSNLLKRADECLRVFGVAHRVRIASIKRGPKKSNIFLFYGWV